MQINADHQLELESRILNCPLAKAMDLMILIPLRGKHETRVKRPYKFRFWIGMKEKLWLDKLIDKVRETVNFLRFAVVGI